jgi:acyl-CoA synthetase (AMP-forming)/AMP-acid ligase II
MTTRPGDEQNTGTQNVPALALHSEKLPRFTFVDDDGNDAPLALPEQTSRVRAVAGHLEKHIAKNAIVGLIYRSSPELVVNWLACVLAGLRPLVVQYPTKKQTHAYWSDSVRNTVSVAGMEAVICDDSCAQILEDSKFEVPVISQRELAGLAAKDDRAFVLDDFSIVQLSSGTTGHRKTIEFTSAQLFAHIAGYNHELELTPADKIASWLPLYHDMGYIACFVMPMVLGIDTVMIDPMTWVRRPELLFDAIERHRATICYMPNFGFEVMARLKRRAPDCMRWWISCSEPVSAETTRKFLDATGTPERAFAPCYAMAENVFAVSIRRGLKTLKIDQADVVSCGQPIHGVQVKIVDDQVWVKSPASLQTYLGGADIRDADGFYATGDLGRIEDGELYITGRAQDLLIQAGQKFMLSDIDLAANRLFPWIRGRAAALQTYDTRLGTQKPAVLIECPDFFRRRDHGEIAAALKDAVGLDQIDVHFVPPRFLTKTSSGKFNRKKSATDWLGVLKARRERHNVATDPKAELREAFAQVDWAKPVEEILDSLSLEVLRIILTGTGVIYAGSLTLQAIFDALDEHEKAPDEPTTEIIKIVSLADRATLQCVTEEHLDRLSAALGAKVTFEHICLPPTPIILSDLIFHDYFAPRLPEKNWTAIDRAFATLKSASLVLVDDVAELLISGAQVYGVLSHGLERHPACDCISVRWQRYPKYHDELPLTFVSGSDLSFTDRTEVIVMLADYLNKPVFKIASLEGFEAATGTWDYRSGKGMVGKKERVDADVFASALIAWLSKRGETLSRIPDTGGERLERNDLGHFCSHFVDSGSIDEVIASYDRFCIAGQKASLPYVRKELERQGKSYVVSASYSPEMLKSLNGQYDCVMICGAQGNYEVEGPAVALMRSSHAWRTQNTDRQIARLKFQPTPDSFPESGTDWFYPFGIARQSNAELLNDVRQVHKKIRNEGRAMRDAHRAERKSRKEAKEARALKIAARKAKEIQKENASDATE